MFIFQYGGLRTDKGEVVVSSQYQKNRFSNVDKTKVISTVKTMLLSGVLHGTDPSDLTQKLNRYQQEFSNQDRDCALLLANGSPSTFHWRSRDTAHGIQVVEFNFEKNDGAEYTTYKSYTIKLEAEFPNSRFQLIEWMETMSCRGTGGRIWRYPPVLEGDPEKQTVRERATCVVVQQGRAIGYKETPPVPAPYFPDDEHEEERDIALDYARNGEKEWPVSWRYVFELKSRPRLNPGQGLQ